MHRGDSLPFWEQACAEGRPRACQRLVRIEACVLWRQCGLGLQRAGPALSGRKNRATPDPDRAFAYFARACEGRFQAGCVNMLDASTPSRVDPRPLDLRLLLREGGPNLLEMPEPELYARACRHGWAFACQKRRRIDAGTWDLGLGTWATHGHHLTCSEARAAFKRQPRSPKPQVPPAFVEIPAGPFTMGVDRASDPMALDNEKWSASAGRGHGRSAGVFHRHS